jgi:transposase
VFCYLQPRNAQAFAVDKLQDKDSLIEALLQERDEMYQELSKLREIDNGSLEQAEKKNERYEALLEEKDDKINKLIDQLSWYRRKFWKSSSEKYIPEDPNQCKIDFDGLDVLPEEEEVIKDAEKEIITYEREKPNTKKQPVRLPLPDHLRREEETIEPEGIDESWVRIGEEVTEVLEHKPGELFVRRIVRPKYVLKTDTTQEEDREESTEKIKIGALPMLPLPRSNAGPSLLAELLISKYMHHLPFHRQLAIFKQSGVSIPASTVNGWFKGSSDLLRALYHRLREIVMETDYLQVDETTVPVIDNKKQRAAKSYLWVVRSVIDNLLFFHYDQGSRAQRVVIDLLRDYQGAVQTDGYEVYRIYEQKKGVLLLGCWAHARRKFTEALKEDKAGAEYALKQIGLIYKVEDMATDQNMNYEQRAELRKRLAYPILRAFEKWLEQYYPKVLPKGRMSKAISYTYNIFHRLSRYHLDGRYQIDNNGVYPNFYIIPTFTLNNTFSKLYA